MKSYVDIEYDLKGSRFRARFQLDAKDADYIRKSGLIRISAHARDFLAKRVGPAAIPNDGKQTPFKGHPVFKAQHATGTCCRDCIAKLYEIPKGRQLTDYEIDHLVGIVMHWIREQLRGA